MQNILGIILNEPSRHSDISRNNNYLHFVPFEFLKQWQAETDMLHNPRRFLNFKEQISLLLFNRNKEKIA